MSDDLRPFFFIVELLEVCCSDIIHKMSSNNIEADLAAEMSCASCGIAEVDDVKLKECGACKSVRYCSDNCQQDHRTHHKTSCRERAAELRDEILFRQPESTHLGDCPICFLPLVIYPPDKTAMQSCCSKTICSGCDIANRKCQLMDSLEQACPFCRRPIPTTDDDRYTNNLKRVEADDPVTLCFMGACRKREGDYSGAFEYWTKAAELGDADAHCKLALFLYGEGLGVEKDEKKKLYHLEEAAIGGNPIARCSLAFYEMQNGRNDRAVKHLIIASNLGHDESLQMLKICYIRGHVSKDDFAAALRAHQAAVDATKSPQREEAESTLKSSHFPWLAED